MGEFKLCCEYTTCPHTPHTHLPHSSHTHTHTPHPSHTHAHTHTLTHSHSPPTLLTHSCSHPTPSHTHAHTPHPHTLTLTPPVLGRQGTSVLLPVGTPSSPSSIIPKNTRASVNSFRWTNLQAFSNTGLSGSLSNWTLDIPHDCGEWRKRGGGSRERRVSIQVGWLLIVHNGTKVVMCVCAGGAYHVGTCQGNEELEFLPLEDIVDQNLLLCLL